MAVKATAAFAPDFAHTSAAPDVSMTFSAGASPVTASVPTGTYRMCLAPSASDFLRVLQTAVNAAIAGAGHTGSKLTITLDDAGVATFTFESGNITALTMSAAIARRFGLSTTLTIGANRTFTGSYPVWGLALLSSVKGGPPQPRQAGGTERMASGRVYSIASSETSYDWKRAVTYQPTTPAHRATYQCDATPMLPADEYRGAIGSTATARAWSVLDLLFAARNALCGFSLAQWPAVRDSTALLLDVGYIDGPSLLSPEITALDETWDAYAEWTLHVSLPTSGNSTTRA